MAIEFSCPHCGHTTQVADHFAGQAGPCAACGSQITIPSTMANPFAQGKPAHVAPQKTSSSSSTLPVVAIVIVAILGVMVVCGGIMAALLLPAVQAAREAARRASCQNNLKQLALAMHNYHDAYKTFPPAYFADEQGRPMRSWRASILPFIEQQPLFERYDFHERWDAPQNEFALNTAIPTFACPSDPTTIESAGTNYVALTGPGTIFEGDKQSRFADIIDGTSNTIMLVEVFSSGIPWSEPIDMDIEEFVAMFGPSGDRNGASPHPMGLHVVLADGSVRFVSFDMDPSVARALATKGGKEAVGGF